MERDNRVYLQHILKACKEISSFIENHDEDLFLRNRILQLAVMKEMEIIGEASKKVSENFRTQHAEIPWKQMAGMRDKLTHEYWDVNYRMVWEVAGDEIPELTKKS